MLKLPPPSPTVTGILSQLGYWNHLGSHGDFSFSGGSGRAICPAREVSRRQEAWLDHGALQGRRRRSEAGALPCREALLQAQPQATLVHLMQFSALQHAVPVLGWHKGLHGQARNQIRQPNLMEITLGGETTSIFCWN